MKPDFKNIKILEVVASKTEPSDKLWLTPEQIKVKNIYTKEDIAGMEHLNYVAGLPPFLRGPYSGMYAMRPWTIRQYAVSRQPKRVTLSIVVTSQQDRKVCLWRLTSLLTADTMPTTNVSWAT